MYHETIYIKCKTLQNKMNTQTKHIWFMKIVQRGPVGPARVCVGGVGLICSVSGAQEAWKTHDGRFWCFYYLIEQLSPLLSF